jgi:hypothetical protein
VVQPLNCFKITLQGPFNVRWADYVGDKLVHVEMSEGTCPFTTLFGYAVDLSAFLGTLHTFIDLGYPVKAFEYREGGTLGEMDGEEV